MIGAESRWKEQTRAMARMFAFGFRNERRLLLTAISLATIASIPTTVMIFFIGLFVDAASDRDIEALALAITALACSVALSWILGVVSARATKKFQTRITVAFESRIASLQSEIPTIEHHERSSILDRLAVLRDETYVLDHMYSTVMQAVTWIARIVGIAVLLASLNPVILWVLPALLPVAVVATVRPVAERRSQELAAPHKRLADHLHRVLTSGGTAKEVRILHLAEPLDARRKREWSTWHRRISHGRALTALVYTAAWGVFFLALAATLFAVDATDLGPAGVTVLLLGGQQLGGAVAALLGEVGYIRGTWMEGAVRMAWLEDFAADSVQGRGAGSPRGWSSLQIDRVNFTYPGTGRAVLSDISLRIPAGTVVAIVGENGSGKSTLVKLIAGFYEASSGDILVDGTGISTLDMEKWRKELSGCFQDFSRFEFSMRESIGVGSLDEIGNQELIARAVNRGGARDLLSKLPLGLDTQLGSRWPDGVGLSGGEWQKVALARACMRESPTILFLDEPTAALDAETEFDLFSRYASAARGSGIITILVSHRLSTVSSADLIVVLDKGKLVEVGSHTELIGRAGYYSTLYRKQAAAYLESSES